MPTCTYPHLILLLDPFSRGQILPAEAWGKTATEKISSVPLVSFSIIYNFVTVLSIFT